MRFPSSVNFLYYGSEPEGTVDGTTLAAPYGNTF